VMAAAASSLDALREWLLDRLDKSPHLTDCTLRQAVRSVILPAPPGHEAVGAGTAAGTAQAGVGLSDATMYTKAAESLANVFYRYLTDCLCAALNPACAPCDDPAVLLACLEVKDCEVVRICNLERTFVLSPTAVRYWVPIGLFGQLIEQACCAIAECPDDREASVVGRSTPGLFDMLIRSDLGRALPSPQRDPLGVLVSLLSSVLSEVCGKDAEQWRSITFAFANLFQTQRLTVLPAAGGGMFSLLGTTTGET
jgi:hypothetical protein